MDMLKSYYLMKHLKSYTGSVTIAKPSLSKTATYSLIRPFKLWVRKVKVTNSSQVMVPIIRKMVNKTQTNNKTKMSNKMTTNKIRNPQKKEKAKAAAMSKMLNKNIIQSHWNMRLR